MVTQDPVAMRYGGLLGQRFGGGPYQFQVVDNWARRPRGWSLGEVTGIAVDSMDNVFVFSRSARPVLVFDKDGNYLRWWGDSNFTLPHGISVGPDDTVYCSDIGDHTIKRFTPHGELLMVLGTPHQNAPRMSGRPFNMPTRAVVGSNGDLFVTDGYGNPSVHVFSDSGELKYSWGSDGSGPGQFRSPHSIAFDQDLAYVVDRANNRIQIFTLAGDFVREWLGLHRPNDLVIRDGIAYVCELEHRLSIWSLDGTRLASWGDEGESLEAGFFVAPHTMAMDSMGSIYVGEVSDSFRGVDRGSRMLQKFVPAV